jgi:hypothetical protein
MRLSKLAEITGWGIYVAQGAPLAKVGVKETKVWPIYPKNSMDMDKFASNVILAGEAVGDEAKRNSARYIVLNSTGTGIADYPRTCNSDLQLGYLGGYNAVRRQPNHRWRTEGGELTRVGQVVQRTVAVAISIDYRPGHDRVAHSHI